MVLPISSMYRSNRSVWDNLQNDFELPYGPGDLGSIPDRVIPKTLKNGT